MSSRRAGFTSGVFTFMAAVTVPASSQKVRKAPLSGSPRRTTSASGEPCPTCGEPIREVAYRSYVVNYCPTCQTDGRILADNTTSKFLK